MKLSTRFVRGHNEILAAKPNASNERCKLIDVSTDRLCDWKLVVPTDDLVKTISLCRPLAPMRHKLLS